MLEKARFSEDLVRRRSDSAAACGFPAQGEENSQATRQGSTAGPRYIEGIQYAKATRGNREANVKWADMDQTLAESSYDTAMTSRSNTGTANSHEIQIAMEKIRIEQKLHNAALMPLGPSTGALRRSNR